MTKPWIWVLLVGALAAKAWGDDPPPAPEAPALPAKLTLDDAVKLLRSRGLDLLIAESAVQSAEGDLRIAGIVPNPSLSLGYGISYYQTCDPTLTQCPASVPPSLSAGLSDSAAIEDTLSGKRGLRKDVAGAALAAAKLTRSDAERNLVFQVKQQFVQVALAQNAVKFSREVAEANTKMLDLMNTRSKAGAVSDADVLRVKTAKLEADQAVDTAIQGERTAKVGLAFLLGVRSAVPDFVAEQPELVHYALPPKLAQATRDSLLNQALEGRPDLLAQKAQVQRSESALALARRQRFPDIVLSLAYVQQGTAAPAAITPPTFSVGLSAPLPILYQQQGEVLKAEADYRTQQLQAAKLQAQVVNDLETAYAVFVATQALVQRMEGGTLLESAKRARDLVFIQYQKGAGSLLDYLTAQATFIATMVEYLGDLTNYWTAVFGLEKAIGAELR